jgi:hypothetical protein
METGLNYAQMDYVRDPGEDVFIRVGVKSFRARGRAQAVYG